MTESNDNNRNDSYGLSLYRLALFVGVAAVVGAGVGLASAALGLPSLVSGVAAGALAALAGLAVDQRVRRNER